jgi:hypothetical protein
VKVAARLNLVAAPPMLSTARYQTFMVFFSTMKRRRLNTLAWISVLVVTPVIAGTEAALIAVQVAPSYSLGSSAPLKQYR